MKRHFRKASIRENKRFTFFACLIAASDTAPVCCDSRYR